MSIRSHREPLDGKTPDDVIDYVKRVMALSQVQEISIEPDHITVKREMESDDTPVVPSGEESQDSFDIEFLLTRMKLRPWPLNMESHPYMILADIAKHIAKRGLHPTVIVAGTNDKELFSAWLGYDEYDEQYFMGFRIAYWDSDQYSGKIVVVGTKSASGYLVDAVEGVVVDLV